MYSAVSFDAMSIVSPISVHSCAAAAAAAAAAAGYTNYLSAFSSRFGSYPQCLNRVHIFEKTLPGLGGRSVVDGGLSDSGAVLAHEVGHQLVSDEWRE
jgi:hypothetical protein